MTDQCTATVRHGRTKRSNVHVVSSFIVGDFIVVCRPTKPVHKLWFRWAGPRRIVSVKSPAVCVMEDLLSRKKETVHATRLKKQDALLDGSEVTDDVRYLVSRTAARSEVVESIVDIETNEEDY